MKKLVLLFTALIAFIDQGLKFLIINNFEMAKAKEVISNFFYITLIKNDGGAFGIMSGGKWIFIVLALVFIIYLIRYIYIDTNITKTDVLIYSLLLGGVIGNLIDRIIYGYVIDYLDFYVFKYDAPIFNFADMCIVIGAVMMIYILLVKGDSSENIFSRKRVK